MTEQQTTTEGTTPPENPPADPTTDAGTTDTYTVPEYKPTAPEGNKGSGRWAVYDMVLERYVSEVTDTKPSSADAKSAAGGHSYRIVEV